MKPETFYKQFIEWCMAHADAELVKKYARFFKEEYDAYGIGTKPMDAKVKELCSESWMDLDLVIKSAPLFFKNGKYEAVSVILMLVNRLKKQYNKALFTEISGWFSLSIRNWAHADMLGMFILPELMRQKLITLHDFDSWLISPYKFQQRCVPVTLIKSAKSGDDPEGLFEYITPLMMTEEREVRQGVGWFLKECWQIDPEKTEAFLGEWKERAPRLIFQIACEKMTPEGKLKFRRSR